MSNQNGAPHTFGIDDMAVYIPRLYLSIEELARHRDLDPDKLTKGLGLIKMSVPDRHEDAATMAANAIRRLLDRNKIDPRSIGRIYLGTESALDDSKPTATYIMGMLEDFFGSQYGEDCFRHCDVVDLNFACVGGVDALQNTLDWVKGGQDRLGIVVSSDIAKYELGSTGEYTQGAGAVAMLVKRSPRLVAIQDNWGVASASVHDFFKPKRRATKHQIVEDVLRLAEIEGYHPTQLLEKIEDSLTVNGILDANEEEIVIHKETPVFDGPYSNQCYQQRIREAIDHFRHQASNQIKEDESLTNRWSRIIFHLPYAFQARRMFSEIYMREAKRSGAWQDIQSAIEAEEPTPELFDKREDYEKAYGKFLRALTKTDVYRQFVKEKIQKGEAASSLVGNMYTGSIFLSLMSCLELDLKDGLDMAGRQLGFIGYGSGSKSKVFEATVQTGWKKIVEQFKLDDRLDNRRRIDYATYEHLHRGRMESSVIPPSREFAIDRISYDQPLVGARYYRWKEAVGEKQASARS